MTKLPHNKQCYWILVSDNGIYLPENKIPFGFADEFNLNDYLGIEIRSNTWLVFAAENEQREWHNLRSQLPKPTDEFHLLNQAVSLNHFFTRNRFCSACSKRLNLANDELALHCSHCNSRIYPTICPAIIVAVRRGRDILLANHLRHKGTIYTTLAGFMETGETIEETIKREIFEETRITVKNLRYFGSQPWAFPNSLMIGFLADYESGEIALQEAEIFDARWFNCDEPLPELPPEGTIARKLIMATLELCRQSNV